ncbi:MAG: sigma 54-interacting transcriptional regulator [Candidatus Fermentibacter sp.]|nr:sigma 54-interacting transcriptional regulator [Candidatus Fermentibacter sp.]
MRKPRCISRRFLPGGREEAISESGSGLSLSRSFTSGIGEKAVRAWFEAISRVSVEGVVVPSCLASTGTDRYSLSIPLDDPGGIDRHLPPPGEVARSLEALHGAGFLHLDLASLPFAASGGRVATILWGDACISAPPSSMAPEVAAGGFCGPWSDFWQFGCYLKVFIERFGSDPRLARIAEELTSHSPRKRAHAAYEAGLFPGRAAPEPVPRLPDRPVSVIVGGAWQTRDAVLDEAVCAATRRGWPARIVRCSPFEEGRPLPGIPPGSRRTVSAPDLISKLFTGVSGVTRLLVVDQADFASLDLLHMLSEMAETKPPHLRLIVSAASAGSLPDLPGAQMLELDDGPSLAEDVPFEAGSPGWAGPSCYGPLTRRSHGEVRRPPAADTDDLWAEGAFRHIAAAWERGLLPPGTRGRAAECFLKTGRPAEALATAGPEDGLVRAGALLQSGLPAEAERALTAPGVQGHPAARARLLSDILLDMGRLAEAEECLAGFSDPESVTRRASVADLRGDPAGALALTEEALASGDTEGRSGLLCVRCTMQMRLGFYSDASVSADEAVAIDRDRADSAGLARSLQERGRVREVLGMWREALEDYRFSSLLSSELGLRARRPVEIDMFVLESRMGLLEDAARTRAVLGRLPGYEPGSTGSITLDLVDSCAAALVGGGQEALSRAERGAARSAELGMPLSQGLCLLYKGVMLDMAGESDEARSALRHSRALAGLLGDRHLSLLSGIALAETGEPPEPGALRGLASGLGLASEELEAGIVTGPDDARSDALSRLVGLPSPLRACILASRFGHGRDRSVLEALRAVRRELMSKMDEETAERFGRITSPLEPHSSSCVPGTAERIAAVLSAFSEWYRGHSAGLEGLDELAGRLGLESLSTTPEAGVLLDAGPPPVYASGSELSDARMIAPLVSAVLGQLVETPRPDAAGDEFPEIRGGSERMMELKSAMSRVARLDLPVLVTGETGTGKELVARGLHGVGRPGGPFVAVDCGAIPEGLLESELFGARRGAYTDLRSDRSGLLAEADGGTLFLDEIGNLPAALQAKLLRVLETGRFRPLGANTEMKAGFRLVAATNADPAELAGGGRFRPDLYYRISVIILRTPPLRERPEDIPELAALFARQVSGSRDISIPGPVLRRLKAHPWPGNVRELRNVVQRAAAFSTDTKLGEKDLAFDPSPSRTDRHFLMEPLERAVGRHVAEVLEACGGSMARAAAVLECDPKTVRKYAGLYGDRLERKRFPER